MEGDGSMQRNEQGRKDEINEKEDEWRNASENHSITKHHNEHIKAADPELYYGLFDPCSDWVRKGRKLGEDGEGAGGR